jgi:hypothetical protein
MDIGELTGLIGSLRVIMHTLQCLFLLFRGCWGVASWCPGSAWDTPLAALPPFQGGRAAGTHSHAEHGNEGESDLVAP